MSGQEPVILIVDDIPSFREVIKDMLQEIGFNSFVEANDGAEALSVIANNPPALVLSDYMMPNVNGIELLKSFKSNDGLKSIPFIMVTGVSEKSVADDANANGVAAIITKPVNFNLLRTTVLKSLSDLMA